MNEFDPSQGKSCNVIQMNIKLNAKRVWVSLKTFDGLRFIHRYLYLFLMLSLLKPLKQFSCCHIFSYCVIQKLWLNFIFYANFFSVLKKGIELLFFIIKIEMKKENRLSVKFLCLFHFLLLFFFFAVTKSRLLIILK